MKRTDLSVLSFPPLGCSYNWLLIYPLVPFKTDTLLISGLKPHHANSYEVLPYHYVLLLNDRTLHLYQHGFDT